jgi:SAM-dependent methyltransferase
LGPVAADALLVANTYHELAHPQSILEAVFRSLIPGGRLVIVDRGPRSASEESREAETQHHELPPGLVEGGLSQQGLRSSAGKIAFIDRPGDLPWWLIEARKR